LDPESNLTCSESLKALPSTALLELVENDCTNNDAPLDDLLPPAGALLVTKRELVVIAEEKEFLAERPSETPSAEESKPIFGGIITFVPCVRLKDFHVSHQEGSGVLALQVHAVHGGKVQLEESIDYLFA
jgi:hypothetical protein